MSSAFIAFLFATGAGTWVYTKLMRNTGGNTRSALTASAIIAVVLFIVFLLLFNTFVPSTPPTI